jgi:hypothetical protein
VCSQNFAISCGAGFFGPSITTSVPNQPSDLSRSGGGFTKAESGCVMTAASAGAAVSDTFCLTIHFLSSAKVSQIAGRKLTSTGAGSDPDGSVVHLIDWRSPLIDDLHLDVRNRNW